MSRTSWTTVTISAALLFDPSIALPCSPAFSIQRHQPKTNQTLPLNGLVHVTGPLPPWMTASWSSDGRADEPITPDLIDDQSLWNLDDLARLRLPGLVAGATITVNIRTGNTPRAGDVELRLTVSSQEDHTPPTITQTPTVTAEFRTAQPPGGCYPWDHFAIDIRGFEATDDVGLAAYTIYEETASGSVALRSFIYEEGAMRPGFAVPVQPRSGRRCFSLVAHDYAGNASPPHTQCLDIAPPTTPRVDAGTASGPDAGTTGAPDASTGTGGSDASNGSNGSGGPNGSGGSGGGGASSGCSATNTDHGAPPYGSAVFALVLLSTSLRSRRRRRSGRPDRPGRSR